eukprot:3804048-Amphidinium_carterae.1
MAHNLSRVDTRTKTQDGINSASGSSCVRFPVITREARLEVEKNPDVRLLSEPNECNSEERVHSGFCHYYNEHNMLIPAFSRWFNEKALNPCGTGKCAAVAEVWHVLHAVSECASFRCVASTWPCRQGHNIQFQLRLPRASFEVYAKVIIILKTWLSGGVPSRDERLLPSHSATSHVDRRPQVRWHTRLVT